MELGDVAKGNHKSGRYTHHCAMSFLSREEIFEITYRGLLAEPSARSCSSMETCQFSYKHLHCEGKTLPMEASWATMGVSVVESDLSILQY